MFPASPFLSLVVTGRNDDFDGDFTRRFVRALRFNYRRLVKAGLDVEIIFVEWRPRADRPWLATMLAESFPDLAGHRLFSYVVDERYHTALTVNERSDCLEFFAKNVGIRRARAPFVLATNRDVYLGRHVVDVLGSRALAPRTLYRATRIDVDDRVAADDAGAFLEDERHHLLTHVTHAPLYSNGSGDFQLMDADGYALVRGFNEVYRLAHSHVDTNLCVKVRGMGLPIVDIGGPVYHVGHGTVVNQDERFVTQPKSAPWGDQRWHKNVVYENPPGWGLRDAPECQGSDHTTFLEFDWRVVAPLVDLRRIVLPAHRGDEIASEEDARSMRAPGLP